MHHEYKQFIDHLQPTPPDIEGPFYKAGAPLRGDGVIGIMTRDSLPLTVSGRVLSADGTPLVDAVLDIWQADEHGAYDNTGYKFRGKVRPDHHGCYLFETIVPADYQIADSPPDYRCAHIHFKVTAPGHASLTTQLYFPDDPYNATDHWFDARRVIQHPVGTFDFVLARAT
jgi:protocatechuate 3,4-dioxygenase beta subunit